MKLRARARSVHALGFYLDYGDLFLIVRSSITGASYELRRSIFGVTKFRHFVPSIEGRRYALRGSYSSVRRFRFNGLLAGRITEVTL